MFTNSAKNLKKRTAIVLLVTITSSLSTRISKRERQFSKSQTSRSTYNFRISKRERQFLKRKDLLTCRTSILGISKRERQFEFDFPTLLNLCNLGISKRERQFFFFSFSVSSSVIFSESQKENGNCTYCTPHQYSSLFLRISKRERQCFICDIIIACNSIENLKKRTAI